MKKIWFAAFVLVTSSLPVGGLAAEGQSSPDPTRVTVSLGASEVVSVSLDLTQVPVGYPYSKAYSWGGDEASAPARIIKYISIVRNGKAVVVPLSAYMDLGNPRGINVIKLPSKGFRVMITGGDAAASYAAILDFQDGEIVRRRIESGEFPKEVWEETSYSFNHLDN